MLNVGRPAVGSTGHTGSDSRETKCYIPSVRWVGAGKRVQTRPPAVKKSFFSPNGLLHRGVESTDLETAIILRFSLIFLPGYFPTFYGAPAFLNAPSPRPHGRCRRLADAAAGRGLQGVPRPMQCPGPSSVRLATHRRPRSRPGRGGGLGAPGSSWVSVSVSHDESKNLTNFC